MDREQTKRYIKHLESGKKSWLWLWDMVYRFVLPERAYLYVQDGSPPPHERVYDSTAINSAERLTNLIISGLCPPWQMWFRLKPGHQITRESDRAAVRAQTEVLEKHIFNLFNQSNFYQEFQPFILDRIVGGTGALGYKETDKGLEFQCVPLSEVCFADDDKGDIIAFSRKYKMPLFLLERKYPKVKNSDYYNTAKENPQEKETLIVFSIRTKTDDWEECVYLEKDFYELHKETRAYPSIIGSRWSKVPGAPYGRGPAIRSLSDIRAANRLKELVMKNAGRTALGIYTVVDDGIINPYTLTLREGSFIPVGTNDTAAPSIAALPPAGDFDVSMISLDRLQSEIKNSFIADQFGPVDKTPMSATEVAERTRVVAQELGMTIGRLEYEVLIPLLEIALDFIKKNNPDIPNELKFDGEVVQIEFTSRLAQSQWAMEDQELSQYMAELAQYAQLDPKLAMLMNPVEAFRYKAELKGIPAKLFRDDRTIEQMVQQAQEAARAEQQATGGQDVG